MAAVHNFRSALGGFNRQDVVQYIEYMNTKHNNELTQLRNQLQVAQDELAKAPDVTELEARLQAAEDRCRELEEALAAGGQIINAPDDELEVYRRAERAERLARERAAQIYAQANAVLADATGKVEAISDDMAGLFEQFAAKMQDGKAQIQEAVATLYAIKPETEEDEQ